MHALEQSHSTPDVKSRGKIHSHASLELLVADNDLDHAIELLAPIPQLRAVLIRRDPIEVCPAPPNASTDQMVCSSSRISREQQSGEEIPD